MKDYTIRKLNADEIECRVGTVKDSGFSLLLYKDARVDMRILDETFGAENWQRDHKEVKGNLFCGIGLWDENKSQWIWKWDCGTESNTEKEKGEASDSFKRAGFNVGIGRELYTAPFVWIKGRNKYEKFHVADIGYDDKGKINKLLIVDNDGVEAYSMGMSKKKQAPKKQAHAEINGKELPTDSVEGEQLVKDMAEQAISETNAKVIEELLAITRINRKKFLEYYEADDVPNIKNKYLYDAMNKLREREAELGSPKTVSQGNVTITRK